MQAYERRSSGMAWALPFRIGIVSVPLCNVSSMT